MIILKRLQVRHFKSLHTIDLFFPTQGSILVEGNNEAGKSTLFESVYFALYGEPLVAEETGERGRARFDTVINYTADSASVTLSLGVDDVDLEVTRTVRRNRPNDAKLLISRVDGFSEEVTGVRPVNDRILQELGNLDKDALLNSCFVEQKKLSKLEDLNGTARRESLAHLLNLDKLQTLQEEMRVTAQERNALDVAEKRHTLAKLQSRIPVLRDEVRDVEEQLDMVAVHEALVGIEEQESQHQQLQARRSDLEQQREEQLRLQERIGRIKDVRAQLRDLLTVRANLDRLATEIERSTQQLDALASREREELPALEQRLAELDRLLEQVYVLEGIDAERSQTVTNIRDIQQRLDEIDQRKASLATLQDRIEQEEATNNATASQIERDEHDAQANLNALNGEHAALESLASTLEQRERLEHEQRTARQALEQAQQRASERERLEAELEAARSEQSSRESTVEAAATAYEQARQRLARASEVRALQQWIQAEREINPTDATQAPSSEADAPATMTPVPAAKETKSTEDAVADAERVLSERQLTLKAAYRRAVVPGALALVALIAAGVLLVMQLFVVGGIVAALGVLLVGLAGWLAFRSRPLRTARLEAQQSLERSRHAHTEFLARKAALSAMGGGETRQAEAVRNLQELDAPVPDNVAEAEERLVTLQSEDGTDNDLAVLRTEEQNERQRYDDARRLASEAATRLGLLQEQQARNPLQQSSQDDAEALADIERRFSAVQDEIATQAASLNVAPERETVRDRLRAHAESMRSTQALLATVPVRQEALHARRSHLDRQVEERDEQMRWLEQHDREALAADAVALEQEQLRLDKALQEQQSRVQQGALQLEVATDQEAIRQERWRTQSNLEQVQKALEQRPALVEQRTTRLNEQAAMHEAATEQWQLLLPLPENIAIGDAAVPGTQTIQNIQQALQEALTALDEPAVSRRVSELDRQDGEIDRDLRVVAQTIRQLQSQVQQWLSDHSIVAELRADAIMLSYPRFGTVTLQDRRPLEARRQELVDQIRLTEHRRDELADALSLRGVEIDEAEAANDHAVLERELAVRSRAEQIVKAVRERMIAKVLPSTERNMSLLLPLLTQDRYRDCQISADYKLQIWDELAGRYVAKNIFSGGTRDQFSLALRLAFALATLPEELGTTPGFIFLDEPLSSFDSPRSEALVNLLTRGQIASNFSQIFVISHGRMFDRNTFTHHLRMENGQAVEHDFESVSVVV